VKRSPRLLRPWRERGAGSSCRGPRSASSPWLLAAVLTVQALYGSAAYADAQETPWEFSVTPYLWLPRVDASMRYEPPGTGGSPISMTDLLQHLNGALFLSAEARKGRWGIAADLVYVDFQKVDSEVTSVRGPGGEIEIPVNSGTTTSLGGYLVSTTANYSLWRWPHGKLDLLGGLQYTHIGTTLDWSFTTSVAGLPARAGSVGRGVDLWDGIVGIRGTTAFGESKWFVPYYLDAGAGTSTFTWQALLGVGYSFTWGDVLLVYRYLSFEQGDAGLVQHLYFSGPALGATFRF